MTVTYEGSLSIGEAMPGAAAASIAGEVGINTALPDIQARLDALLAFTPTPINFAASLTLALNTLASVQAGIAGALPAPDISAQIAIVAAEVSAVLASVTAINTQLEICLDFTALMANAGVHLYSYNGAANAFGSEFAVEFTGGLPGGAGGAETIDAVVLATNVPGTWSALSTIMGV